MFDLVLRGGRVFDGAGNSDVIADVAIEHGHIAALGGLRGVLARQELDITGLAVAPGFIDVHSHSDALPFNPEPIPAKILQGVTTEVTGNCGTSPFPLNPKTVASLREHQGAPFEDLPYDWQGLSGYAQRLVDVGPVSNVAPLVGHNAVRAAVLGFESRAPTTSETLAMQRLVEEALEDGAVGFSSGLIYAPGVYSETSELVALASVMRGSGCPYATHIRGETHNLFAALDEAVEIGEAAGVSVQVSHLKAAGRPNFGRATQILERIEAARARGLEVTGDIYPYDAGSGKLASVLPPWCQEGGMNALLQRLDRPDARERLAREFAEGLPGWVNLVEAAGWDNIWIASVDRNPAYLGKSIQTIADERGSDPTAALCDVLLEEEGRPTMILRMMDERDVEQLTSHPLVMIGSDAIITRGRPHPRTWGTYPRVLGLFSRELGLFSQAEAIRKMTSYPAQKFGLFDRGLVRPGLSADLVIFDPHTVRDRATDASPEQAPIGMPHVLVNGEFAVRDGRYTGARAGKVLRPSGVK
jgi:N-acyl-D-aspartate/D-glutamate deacylase